MAAAAADAADAAEARAAPCDIYRTRDVQGFHFRVSHRATRNLAAGQYVEKVLALVNGFRVTARCWPRWEAFFIKLSIVITSLFQPQHKVQAPKLASATIELRTRDGLPVRTGTQQPETVTDDCFGGVVLYASRDEVEQDCLVDGDHFTAICTVAILRDWPPLDLPVPYNLGSVIFGLPHLSDVSFQVGGHTFRAHRLVLAACSPVFRAMLFGEMVESRASSIAIQDDETVRPSTFGCMLYYMYHNVLPPAPAGMDAAAEMTELQRLFVAADMYGLDKLKETCEEMMLAGVRASTVLSIMEFAEERTRPRLKAKCLDFLTVPGNFQEVAATQEYLDLMTRVPSLLAEVRDRCKRPTTAICRLSFNQRS